MTFFSKILRCSGSASTTADDTVVSEATTEITNRTKAVKDTIAAIGKLIRENAESENSTDPLVKAEAEETKHRLKARYARAKDNASLISRQEEEVENTVNSYHVVAGILVANAVKDYVLKPRNK